MLTRMLNERAEVRTIYNACVACMLVFLSNILLQQYMESGNVSSLFELDLFAYAFGQIGTVALVWTAMFASTFFVFAINFMWRQGEFSSRMLKEYFQILAHSFVLFGFGCRFFAHMVVHLYVCLVPN
jgi:hypothetical protein